MIFGHDQATVDGFDHTNIALIANQPDVRMAIPVFFKDPDSLFVCTGVIHQNQTIADPGTLNTSQTSFKQLRTVVNRKDDIDQKIPQTTGDLI